MRLDAVAWSERSACPGLAPVSLCDVLQGVNDAIMRANRRINDLPGMTGVDYADQSGEIIKVAEDLVALIGYVDDLPGDIANRLDQPLFEAFANGPTQAISQIHAEDLTTANTPGVTATTTAVAPGFIRESVYVKESISFDDFFGAPPYGAQIPYFAETFKADYDAWKQHNSDQYLDLSTYSAQVLASGEFDHEGYHPVQSFVSSVLDFTIVWPIYKAITGHDPITGEDLEEWERAVGAGMAVVDLVALLVAIPSGGASVAGAAVARTVVRELLVNALATGVSLLIYDMAVALDLPPWLATLAAMGVGLGISVAGTRAVIRRLDAAGKPIGDPIEIDLTKPKTPAIPPKTPDLPHDAPTVPPRPGPNISETVIPSGGYPKTGSGEFNYPSVAEVTIPDKYSFGYNGLSGPLRGDSVTIDVYGQPFTYIKRATDETRALRQTFERTEKTAFLKHLGENEAALRDAGFNDAEIALIKAGKNPDPGVWQVHHKYPLDDSGTNDFNNLVLIKNEPYHKIITNYGNALTRGEGPGYTVETIWPVIPGAIYPATHA
ncbi:MAG: pre-toxin TG domain-containing protein [Propionibacteriaceae bacterium]|nr:pre-toxin TG domain-containing protein [Propionibacteriaceae bacterium]